MNPTLAIEVKKTHFYRDNHLIDENGITWKPFGNRPNLYYCADANFGPPDEEILAYYIPDYGLFIDTFMSESPLQDYMRVLEERGL